MYDPEEKPRPPLGFKLLIASYLGFPLVVVYYLRFNWLVCGSVIAFHLSFIGLLLWRRRWARRAAFVLFTLSALAGLSELRASRPLDSALSFVPQAWIAYLLNRRDVCRWCDSGDRAARGRRS